MIFIYKMLGEIKMLLKEAFALLTEVSEQDKKILVEIQTKFTELQNSIDALTEQLAKGVLTPEQEAAVQAVVDGANALDALVPDADEA